MRDQAVYLTLVFAVDLIQKVEPEDMLANRDLVAVLQGDFSHPLAVEISAVARAKIRQNVIMNACFRIEYFCDLCVPARSLVVVNADVGAEERPRITSSRSSGIGTAISSPLRKTSAGLRSSN